MHSTSCSFSLYNIGSVCHILASVPVCYIALSLGLRESTPDAAAEPTNGATESASDKPKVSLCMRLTTGY